MNKRHEFAVLEREYVTSDISIRELCRRHDISAHSLVTVQARKLKWAEKREQYQARESDAFMSRRSARMADRLAEIHDKAIDVIDEALDRFREAMRATERKRIDGEWVEVPVMRLKPKDVAILIDRLMVLLDRPSRIGESRDLNVRSELPIEALNQFIELARGRAAPPTSSLPRRRRLETEQPGGWWTRQTPAPAPRTPPVRSALDPLSGPLTIGRDSRSWPWRA